jgi:DNA primase
MARCPFHNDRTLSMKLGKRYHCFGCGESGDQIDYVGRLFGLDSLDSAKKYAVTSALHMNGAGGNRRVQSL